MIEFNALELRTKIIPALTLGINTYVYDIVKNLIPKVLVFAEPSEVGVSVNIGQKNDSYAQWEIASNNCRIIPDNEYGYRIVVTISIKRTERYLDYDIRNIIINDDQMKDVIVKSRRLLWFNSYKVDQELLESILSDYKMLIYTELNDVINSDYKMFINSY